MTLDSKLSKAVYQGNGSTTVFPFAFKVWDASQIAVTVTDAAGVSTDVTSNSTVTFTSSGGSVAYPKSGSPLPGGAKLAITRNMPFTQGINLTTASRFDPQVLEDGLDQATAERQQILEQMARAVILPATSSESPEDVVASIYASRDAAAASASTASNKADAVEVSAQAAANSASTAAQTVENAAAEAVADATAQANAAHDSALAAAQSAAEAEAAVPDNLVARVTTLETETDTQQTALSVIIASMPPLGGVASITGATTLDSSAFGKLHICSGSTDYTVALPPASGNAGKTLHVRIGVSFTRLVTLSCADSSTIDNAASRIMWAGESAQLYCDGTAWYKIGGQSIPMFGRMYLGANQSVAHAVNTKVLLNNSNGTRAPAQMCDTSNNRIMVLRSSIWTIKVDSHIFTTTPIASTMQTAIYRNGAYFSSVNRYVPQSESPVVQDTETLMFAAGDYFEAYVIHYFNASMVFDGLNTLNSMTVLESPIW